MSDIKKKEKNKEGIKPQEYYKNMHYLQQCQVQLISENDKKLQNIKQALVNENDRQKIEQLKYEKRQIKKECMIDYYYQTFNYMNNNDEESFKKLCMIRCGQKFDVQDFEEEKKRFDEQQQNEIEFDCYDAEYQGFTSFSSASQQKREKKKNENHLDGYLDRLQGLEKKDILEDDIIKIKAYIQNNLKQDSLGLQELVDVLHKLGMQQYKQNINKIMKILTDYQTLSFNIDERNIIKEMFEKINTFNNTRRSDAKKKNLPRYEFLMKKIFEAIGKKEYCKHIYESISLQTVQQYEQFWQQVCDEYGWQ